MNKRTLKFITKVRLDGPYKIEVNEIRSGLLLGELQLRPLDDTWEFVPLKKKHSPPLKIGYVSDLLECMRALEGHDKSTIKRLVEGAYRE